MKKIFLATLISIILISLFNFDFISARDNEKPLKVYFFYSKFCPHCAREKEFLQELEKRYPEIQIEKYEVTSSPENQKILSEFFDKYNVPERERGWVPVTFTPHKYFIGFNDQIAKDLEKCLKACLENQNAQTQKIRIPIFGEVDLSELSLPVLTVVFGALDGLNPCAMWVLLFLIVLLLNTRSRKRLWLIGGTFITVSGIVYYLILAAWLNLFLAISYVNLTRILIGVFALTVGVLQIRSFIKYQPGVCKVTDGKVRLGDKIRNGLKNHAQKIAFSPLTFGILLGVIALAFGVNLVEFFCSAGLPAVYTRILTLSKLNSLTYYLYLLLYTFLFMLDDLVVFLVAVITLTKIGFSEKYNYWATLIGGLLMLVLGILLIFKPQWLMFA
jgi:thiol-disulfide isomerase/thioredoxin